MGSNMGKALALALKIAAAIAAMIVTIVIAAMIVAWPTPALADEFALVFRQGDVAPDSTEANRATLGRLQQALAFRTSGAAFEILLVGPRPTYCTSASACNELLFRRLRHVRDTLARRDATAAKDLHDNAAKYAGELLPAPTLPTEIVSGDALYVRTRLSRPVRADEACPWTVHISDPMLPPGLDGQPVDIQAVSPRQLSTTAASAIRFTPTGHRGRPTAIVWDGKGRYALGQTGVAVALAAQANAERVHLIAADTVDHPLLRAAERSASIPPAQMAELLARAAAQTSKAFGDQASRMRVEDLSPPRAGPDVVVCTVTLQTIAAVR